MNFTIFFHYYIAAEAAAAAAAAIMSHRLLYLHTWFIRSNPLNEFKWTISKPSSTAKYYRLTAYSIQLNVPLVLLLFSFLL
jgi:hypothetical protein